MVRDDTLAQAKAWLAHDPDPETRAELGALIESESDELRDRFSGPLEFGTAGLRGVLGAGESRMNRAVVLRTAAGLGHYLRAHHPGAATQGVVIGYDGRRLSDVFARDTAEVLSAQGIVAHLSSGVCPTPMVAYAVTALGAAAGVMVTASHNPPEYNGYKVYAENGAQIVPPADSLIAEAIAAVGPADAIERRDLADARAAGLVQSFGDALDTAYLEAIVALVGEPSPARRMPIVYTPLHGVGAPLLERAFALSGFSELYTVAAQREPDGAFPTVRFPNPEEKGALDLALALAAERAAPLVLANDPDADRLAAAVRDRDGRYVQLTGNEVGALLGHHLLSGGTGPDRIVITTIVSSPILRAMAAAHGVAYAETLTGFKWIANKAMETPDRRFVFGYEEALGYTVGTIVRDKDGIGAALVLADLAAALHARGESLLDELERIARTFGLYASAQRSLSFPGADGQAAMAALLERLRSAPPRALAGREVAAFTDVLHGRRRRADADEPVDLPASNVLIFELEGGSRVIARPSGTEPKMKLYFDVREPMRDGEELAAAKARASEQCQALERAILEHLDV